MREEAKTSNDTNIIQMQLKNKINEGDSIIIADENENRSFLNEKVAAGKSFTFERKSGCRKIVHF